MQAMDKMTDAATLILGALTWILTDDARADRLLALTGMDVGHLRATIDSPATLAAIGGFLLGHEADLIACADALGVDPAMLAAAARGV